MTTAEFKALVSEGIPVELPLVKPYESSLNHAPRRKDILTVAEKKLAEEGMLELTIGQQVEVLSKYLPLVLRRHLTVILDSSTSNRDVLTAIKLFYETLGLTPESMAPTRMGRMIVNVLQMVTPQLAAISKERGIVIPGAVQTVIEGQYEVKDGDPNSETEKHAEEEHSGEMSSLLDLPGEGQEDMADTHGDGTLGEFDLVVGHG